MTSRPNSIYIEMLVAALLFGVITWLAFHAGYWRHDDPTYSLNEWYEFQGAGRFLLAFLHPWVSTLNGGIAFSLSCILVYILALKKLSNTNIRSGLYLIPLLLILNIPFFEITTWSGQSLIAASMLVFPDLIFQNHRTKLFFACILVWGVHPSYAPLCLIYLVGKPSHPEGLREPFVDALYFIGGIISAYLVVQLLHGLWFGFSASLNQKLTLDFSNVFQTYKAALLERSPNIVGGYAMYFVFFSCLTVTIIISILRRKREALYFGLISLSILMFWPFLFSISQWSSWGSSRNFIFLGVAFFFCALSIQRLLNKNWLYIFLLASSLPAQMALSNFYTFSSQTNTIKSAFRELVGNYEGLIPVVIDARDGDVRRWVRLPYSRQEVFSNSHIGVPRFTMAMPMSLCVSEHWGDFQRWEESIAENCRFFDGLSELEIVQCSVNLPVICSYGVVSGRLLLKVVD